MNLKDTISSLAQVGAARAKTLKRLKIENGNIFLIPENPEFSPIVVKELRVLGRVVGVLRKY